jgi:signal transduction histidine kinase
MRGPSVVLVSQNVAPPPAAANALEKITAEAQLAKGKDAMDRPMDRPNEPLEGQDFGAVLRHELNNPLTGILGNAELLLAEIRRSADGRLPPGGLQRLETIAALAVRMRETIRRVSQEWVADSVVRKKPEA